MLKKLALIGILSLSLVGCSNTAKENNSGTSNEKTSTTENNQGKSETQSSNLECVSSEVKPPADGYIESKFVIKNNTNDTINTISLVINELDKEGNILNVTSPQEPTKVKSGQTIAIKGTHEEGETSKVELISYSYYDSKGDYIEEDFPEGIIVNMK